MKFVRTAPLPNKPDPRWHPLKDLFTGKNGHQYARTYCNRVFGNFEIAFGIANDDHCDNCARKAAAKR